MSDIPVSSPPQMIPPMDQIVEMDVVNSISQPPMPGTSSDKPAGFVKKTTIVTKVEWVPADPSVTVMEAPPPETAEEVFYGTLPKKAITNGVVEPGPVKRKNVMEMDLNELVNLTSGAWEGPYDPASDEFDEDLYWDRVLAQSLLSYGSLPEVTIIFRHLTVNGAGTKDITISTFLEQLIGCVDISAAFRKYANRKNIPPKVILSDIDGCLRPREMLFVIGRPGSGCSSLMRALSGQHREFASVLGDVLINGMDVNQFNKTYPGQTAYAGEADNHYPNLTVGQTLDFALRNRMPTVLDMQDTREQKALRLRGVVMKTLGISHTVETKVGDEVIRGVSGGEKKRVSIAEQLICRSAINFYDGSTKGLDSVSALKFTQALRFVSDKFGLPITASFYQASEEMYECFDKVLVLAEGYCIFSGPIGEAKAYFEGLGFVCPARMTTPDFLTIVTDLNARQVAPGYEQLVPKTALEFNQIWKASPAYQAVQADIKAAEMTMGDTAKNFQNSYVQARYAAGTSLKAAYPTSFWEQLSACMIREFQLQLGNPAALIIRIFFFGVMALIAGGVYYQLPLNGSGAFSRGGVLFFSMVFTSSSSLVEMPETINGRSTLYKHQSFHLYRSSAFYIARVIADLPLRFILLLVFSNILFWLVGLGSGNPGVQYALFFLILFVCSTSFTALIRCIALYSSDLNVAQRYGGIILILLLLFNGYLIRSAVMPPWFGWIVWVNPLAYGLKALLANEFALLTFTCDGTSLVPFGPTYANVPITYKACTIPGSQPGSATVSGADYLAASYGFPATMSSIWIDIAAMIGFFLLYVILAIIAVEFVKFGKGGATTNVFKKQSFLEAKRREQKRGADVKQETMIAKQMDIPSAPPFTWTNLDYTVPVKGGSAQLLNHINGRVVSGRMVALMGSSGAGKTTLLDVLAMRKTIGKIEGELMVGDKPQDDSFRRMIGYAEQMDVHMTTATVREALRFSANLRQPATVPQAEKNAYVEEIIKLLEMESIADAMIGTLESGLGLSMEERKRLTIGVELVAKPQILFLDEPTSGLDSNASANLIRLIRNLADHNQAIICTIHQPSAMLFENFDDLLLLARGGKTVYFGPIGPNSSVLKEYFERYGAPPLAPDANPAEWILEFAAGKSHGELFDWHSVWNKSPEYGMRLQEIQDIRNSAAAKSVDLTPPELMGNLERTRFVMKRAFVNYWRLGDFNFGRTVLQVVVGLILGLSFFRLQPTLIGIQSMMFALFQTSTLGVILVQAVQPQWFVERPYFFREASAGYYLPFSYVLSNILVDIPYILLGSSLFFVIFYYMTGMNPESGRAAFFWLTYSVFCLFCGSLGQMLSSFSPMLQVAQIITPILSSIFSLFAGVTISYLVMSPALSWMQYLDPYRYYIEATLVNQLHDLQVTCAPTEFVVFNPPPGQTCGSYANTFVSMSPGYLNNPNASSGCQFCPISTGDDYLTAQLGWSWDARWICFGVLLAMVILNKLLTFVFVKLRGTGGSR